MTDSQKISLIQTTVKAYLANREAQYNGRGFKRAHEMEAISKIERQMSYVEELGFYSHCSMVRTLNSDILAIAPETNESDRNQQAWKEMRSVLKACKRQIAGGTPVQSKLFT